MNLTDLSLLRLLQLASPMLPVGAYSYSQGLEWAVDQRIVHDRDSAQMWIGDVLQFNVARFEAPLLLRLYRAWERDDFVQLAYWNEVFCVSREAAESLKCQMSVDWQGTRGFQVVSSFRLLNRWT